METVGQSPRKPQRCALNTFETRNSCHLDGPNDQVDEE